MKTFTPRSSLKTPLLRTVLRFLSVLGLGLTGLASAAEKQPNIVFFLTDDQSTNTIGCYGNEVLKTPNIDRLAEQGTRFNNAFVSQPICWVSRTTILTGLTGRSYGTSSNPELARPDAVKTLYTDILREKGYRTAHFGKWHAKMPKGWKREDHFDVFEDIGRLVRGRRWGREHPHTVEPRAANSGRSGADSSESRRFTPVGYVRERHDRTTHRPHRSRRRPDPACRHRDAGQGRRRRRRRDRGVHAAPHRAGVVRGGDVRLSGRSRRP